MSSRLNDIANELENRADELRESTASVAGLLNIAAQTIRRHDREDVTPDQHAAERIAAALEAVADNWRPSYYDRAQIDGIIRWLREGQWLEPPPPPPVCCGAPMRKAAFPGWICNGGVDPILGAGCDRHEAPDGVRTPGPWWKEPPGLAARTRRRCEAAATTNGALAGALESHEHSLRRRT